MRFRYCGLCARAGISAMLSYYLRPLSLDDIGLLPQFLYLAILVPGRDTQPPFSILETDPELLHYWQGFGSRPGDIGVVALGSETESTPESESAAESEEIIGIAWGRLFPSSAPGFGYLDDDTPEVGLAVLPDWRGKGVGTALLKALMNYYASDKNAPNGVGYQRVSLSTAGSNVIAQKLYRRLGFEIVSTDAEGDLKMVANLRSSTPSA